MHAARVTSYIKILHLFRQEQNDTALKGLEAFATEIELNTNVLIHLTQIAAVFHDVARKDEGEDRWDIQSSETCFEFFQTVAPSLNSSIARLIANTIAYKDSKSLYLKFARSIRLSEEQAEQADYLRQLLHDADCLDIMRVRKTFKMQYLELCQLPSLKNSAKAIIQLVQDIGLLINYQGDQYKKCQIEVHQKELDNPKPLEANFDIERKCHYEWSSNVLTTIVEDMKDFPILKLIDKTESSPEDKNSLE